MGDNMVYVWAAIIILTLIAEGLTKQMICIWFTAAAVPALVLAFADLQEGLQITVFLIAAAVLLICTRPIAKRLLNKPVQHTNADRILGETAVVIEDINNDLTRGLVRVSGQVWSARSAGGENIASGSKVSVRSIEGVKAIVELIN